MLKRILYGYDYLKVVVCYKNAVTINIFVIELLPLTNYLTLFSNNFHYDTVNNTKQILNCGLRRYKCTRKISQLRGEIVNEHRVRKITFNSSLLMLKM